MKHKASITLILLSMFLIAQFIGLFVINAYHEDTLPFGFEPSEELNELSPIAKGINLVIAFAMALGLILILMKYKWRFLIRFWFFAVVTFALIIAINAFLKSYIASAAIVSLAIALPLAFLKIYKPNIYSHNLTELLVYPGIAAVFVPILSIPLIIVILILISLYDMWAVWKSGLMVKMAKFQMEELNIFGGLLIPKISKTMKAKIKKLKKSKSKKGKGIKVQLAILGGGDIVFPLIAAGVFLTTIGIIPALFVIFGAFAGLLYIFTKGNPKKPYPAMPYITVGIFIALTLWKLLSIAF